MLTGILGGDKRRESKRSFGVFLSFAFNLVLFTSDTLSGSLGGNTWPLTTHTIYLGSTLVGSPLYILGCTKLISSTDNNR